MKMRNLLIGDKMKQNYFEIDLNAFFDAYRRCSIQELIESRYLIQKFNQNPFHDKNQ